MVDVAQLERTSDLISVIVPTLNEEQALPETVRQLLACNEVLEVIAVDGGSSDGTCDWLRANAGARLKPLTSAPGRAVQMNAGAKVARGEWLLFHHADTRLPATGLTPLARRHSDRSVQWGGFRHRFSHSNWKLRLISWMHNVRCARSGVVYGDQSMFVRRTFFYAVGGFPAGELEDLTFSDKALLQAPSHLLPDSVTTDSRKFRAMGEFRALWHVVSIVWRYERARRIGNEAFFEPYR